MKPVQILLVSLSLLFLQACIPAKEDFSQILVHYELKKAGLELQTVQVGGAPVVYYERKADGPAVVLLHGFSSDKKDWIRFVRYLPKHYRVIVPDLPGHGDNTQKKYSAYDPDALKDGVKQVVDAIGLDRFHLAGNSLGGLVSKLYALGSPESIISLGLFDSAGVIPVVPGDFYDALEKGHNPFDVKTKADWEKLKAYAFYDPPFIPWPMNDVILQDRIRKNAFYMEIFKTVTGHPAFIDPGFQKNMLENLSMPVLVLWGDNDRILNVSSTAVYSKFVKNLHTVILKDCGHIPMIEMPEISARHYSEFIVRF